MKIVITDGYTLNPGDLSWDEVTNLGDVSYYDRTQSSEIVSRCRDAEILITNKTPMRKEHLLELKHLKMIAVTATGYNIVDVDEATKNKVVVCNVPVYGTESVAQHTIALLLELVNHVGANSSSVHDGEWASASDWCYTKNRIVELKGKTMGIIGFGRIGEATARIAQALGMNIIFYNSSLKSNWAKQVTMGELATQSDFISIHCPLTPENNAFVNKRFLALMKRSAYLINTSRGALINECDLADAINQRGIAGAALDVLSVEPPLKNHPLIGIPNCIITPHTAWLSFDARERIMQTTVENIRRYQSGNFQNVVNPF